MTAALRSLRYFVLPLELISRTAVSSFDRPQLPFGSDRDIGIAEPVFIFHFDGAPDGRPVAQICESIAASSQSDSRPGSF
jgi:hypothetical protein